MTAKMKERALVAALCVAAAYAFAAGYWFIFGEQSWKDAQKKLKRTQDAYERERKTISQRTMWDERYDEEASQIPVVEAGQGADTVWMGVMDAIAKESNVFVTERRPGKEEVSGDMQQTTVDIRWNGAFESLVKFLYALENSDKGKFDVQSINFAPGKRKGYLSGSMTLVCIFKRK